MRTRWLISAVFLLSTGGCYAQWSKQDSVKLRKMLEADGELRLNRKALQAIDFSVGTTDPRISEEKRWLSPDESLPSVLPKAVPVFSLMPYTPTTRYDWDPVFRKKIRITKDTWRGDPFSHLYARTGYKPNTINLGKGVTGRGTLQRGADFVPPHVAVHCYGAAGVEIGGLDLMLVFTKDFWDRKGKKRRARTLEVLKTYGDSVTISINAPAQQIVP